MTNNKTYDTDRHKYGEVNLIGKPLTYYMYITCSASLNWKFMWVNAN